MATMKSGEEAEGEVPKPRAMSMAGYNNEIDAIREEEFPMLQGRLAELQIRRRATHELCRSDLSRPRRHNFVPQISHR